MWLEDDAKMFVESVEQSSSNHLAKNGNLSKGNRQGSILVSTFSGKRSEISEYKTNK